MSSADMLRLISLLQSMSLMKISNRYRPRTDTCRYRLITTLHPNNEQFVIFSMAQFYNQFGIHPVSVSQWIHFYLTFEKSKICGIISFSSPDLFVEEIKAKYCAWKVYFPRNMFCLQSFFLQTSRLLQINNFFFSSEFIPEIELQFAGQKSHGLLSFLFWRYAPYSATWFGLGIFSGFS